MNRITKLISAALALAVMTTFCSCNIGNSKVSETTAATTETVVETTAEPSPTPTPEPTATSTPTPTPIPTCGLEDVCPVLTSCIGVTADEALKEMEKFFGVKLDDYYETTNYDDKPCYFVNLNVVIEGVTFTSLYILSSADEDGVEFISFSNPDLTEKEMKDNYDLFDDILEEMYGGSDLSVDEETVSYSDRTADDGVLINTGYLIGEGGSLWLNATLG